MRERSRPDASCHFFFCPGSDAGESGGAGGGGQTKGGRARAVSNKPNALGSILDCRPGLVLLSFSSVCRPTKPSSTKQTTVTKVRRRLCRILHSSCRWHLLCRSLHVTTTFYYGSTARCAGFQCGNKASMHRQTSHADEDIHIVYESLHYRYATLSGSACKINAHSSQIASNCHKKARKVVHKIR